MTDADIKHFLVTYDPGRGNAAVRELGTDCDAAQDAYQRAEQQARGTNLDVVLLSADSLETINAIEGERALPLPLPNRAGERPPPSPPRKVRPQRVKA
jgi:hypothetical protein